MNMRRIWAVVGICLAIGSGLAVAQGAIDYADLKVKPGQTIRILAKESCGYKAEDDGLFPEILLTLK